jgi:hypothetical protein
MEAVALGADGEVLARAGLRGADRETQVHTDEVAREARIGVLRHHAGRTQLHVRAARELPEVLQAPEDERQVSAGHERVAIGCGGLEIELVGAAGQGDGQGRVEREPNPCQTFLREITLVDQRVFAFGEGVEVPAVEVAHRLPELAEIHAQPAGKAGPIEVALLDLDPLLANPREDFRVRVRVERGLEREFHFVKPEIRTLVILTYLEPHVGRGANLGVQRREIPLPADELGGRRVLGGRHAGLGGRAVGGGPDRGKRIGGIRRGAGRRTLTAPRGDRPLDALRQGADRGGERIDRHIPPGSDGRERHFRPDGARTGLEGIESGRQPDHCRSK